MPTDDSSGRGSDMTLEKGQKYRSGNYTFTVLSDVFEAPGGRHVAYLSDNSDVVKTSLAVYFEGYTLIREPKFKVGDRVTYAGGGEVYEIVAISPDPDPDGDFAHLVKGESGYFGVIHTPEAAE
jgi:hypothetical protein